MTLSKIATYQEITQAIKTDDFDFLKSNFMSFVRYYLEANSSGIEKIVELLLLAGENNSSETIKFFLSDKEIDNYFGETVYSPDNIQIIFEYVTSSHNTEIMLFLCQSIDISHNINLTIDINKVRGISILKPLVDFFEEYQKKIKEIEDLFEQSKKNIETLPEKEAILFLQDILNNENLTLYSRMLNDKLKEQLNFAFEKDNVLLVEFLLENTRELDLTDIYESMCHIHCPNSIPLLMNKMYLSSLSNPKENNFDLREGLIEAIKRQNNYMVKTILEQPYDSSKFDLAWCFSTALNTNNFEAVSLIFDKSITYKEGVIHSEILDEYPYYDIFNLISSDISEENLINSIKYLFENDIFNPRNYDNYSFQGKKFDFKTTPEKIFQKLVDKGYTKVLDFILENKYFNLDSNMINENLIKSVIYNTLNIHIGKKMADYIMMEFKIYRTSEFHNFLKTNINDLHILPDNSIAKEINQYFLDHYDSFLFNELLSEKINKIPNKQQKKKKV